MRIVIRPWQEKDLGPIREITWRSWMTTYSRFIPETDLKSYLDLHYTKEVLLNMFNDPLVHGFVAENEDQVAGFVRLSFDLNENRLNIPSLHVLSEFQGRGIGRRLLDRAEKYAVGRGLDKIWIGVMIKNRRALALYRRVGFVFVHEEPFTLQNTKADHLIGWKRVGKDSFLDGMIHAVFGGGDCREGLSALCLDLLLEQRGSWEELRRGYESLRDVKERDVACRGFSIRLHYNPGRLMNTTAGAEESAGGTRPCFLCLDRLPEGQHGILWRGDYLVLCNPRPIFPSHLTVSHLDHRRQAIEDHIDAFLGLAADLGPGWTVLYNGPRCGASAPDHLHFQAVPSGRMVVEKEGGEEGRFCFVAENGRVRCYRARDLGREVILLEGDDSAAVSHFFRGFTGALKTALSIEDEPMMNIAGSHRDGKWRLLIFPRRRHRPDAFFDGGAARLVVSPGVIDMGGVLITPVEKDFNRLDGDEVEGIYREVSLEGRIVERALEAGMLEEWKNGKQG
jgi:ribosomal protein S18 acetylase RimI-like enzyme